MLHAKLGVTIPSSQEKDEDRAFSMPLGNDGAWGLPLGLGIDVAFVHNITLGLNAEFLILFDKSRVRRLKTREEQTEFLLLHKGVATKEHGLTWQFHLYFMLRPLTWFSSAGKKSGDDGLWASFDYQFVRHDDDRLNPRSNEFSFAIVNSARSLKEWTIHNLLFRAGYNFANLAKKWPVSPEINLFYKLPVAGKNIIDNHSFGGTIAINF